MYKMRSKVTSGLLVLTCLMTSFAFSQPPSTTPTQTPPTPALTSDKFKEKVAALDAQTQSKLDAAIAKLLGSSQSAVAAPITAPQASPASTPPETQTPSSSPESTPTTTPSPASSSSGLNLLGN